MRAKPTPWESFLETGSIDDYLAYCNSQKQRMFSAQAEGALDTDEVESPGDSPAGLQA